jgi:predicted ArsR family transcriptional regulator
VHNEFAEQVAGIGALSEPTRRMLYEYVVAQPDAVSRERAANAVELPLHSVKFHLDRLVADGLLEVEYRRLSGRTGPGAGRPAKLYRRASREVSVSLPERRYDLAGDVLATAIDRALSDAAPIAQAVRDAARVAGRRLATTGTDDRSGSGLDRTAGVLAGHGYEPRPVDHEIWLANCPFDRLANAHRELVCGLNLALIDGVIEELGAGDVSAELAPEPGHCCVKLRG